MKKTENPRLAGIALGANLGESMRQLESARDRLRGLAVAGRPFLQAPVYRSAPVDCPPGSPEFLNSAVVFHWGSGARELLAATQRIERALGRPAVHGHHTPRPIDVDILWLGDELLTSRDLTLPHPRMRVRRFVLAPLAAIVPELVLPGDTLTIAEHLDRLGADEPRLEMVRERW